MRLLLFSVLALVVTACGQSENKKLKKDLLGNWTCSGLATKHWGNPSSPNRIFTPVYGSVIFKGKEKFEISGTYSTVIHHADTSKLFYDGYGEGKWIVEDGKLQVDLRHLFVTSFRRDEKNLPIEDVELILRRNLPWKREIEIENSDGEKEEITKRIVIEFEDSTWPLDCRRPIK